MFERERIQRWRQNFYSWDESSTGSFDKQELAHIRDEHPQRLAQALSDPGRNAQNLALFELMTHGNPRKAALLARNLVLKSPQREAQLTEDVGEKLSDYLLNTDIFKLPSKPEEYPR